jgi:uncharacterized protein (DUF1697 family)
MLGYIPLMVYVALLRGVNVGGTGKVAMPQLKAVFEAIGMSSVRTYINSGNVIFTTDAADNARLTKVIEDAIEQRFGFAVRVLVRDVDEIRSVVEALPMDWANDEATKCDVFFLWPEVDTPAVVERLDHDPDVDDVRYTPGAVIRRVDRKSAPRSRLTRVVSTPLYQQMTIRNCNTARKLLELMGG